MGLFDSLVNAAGDMMGQDDNTLSAVSNLIQENGGVGGLVEKFQQGGLELFFAAENDVFFL